MEKIFNKSLLSKFHWAMVSTLVCSESHAGHMSHTVVLCVQGMLHCVSAQHASN